MSVENLLEKLAILPGSPEKTVSKPLNALADQAGSLGSPGSHKNSLTSEQNFPSVSCDHKKFRSIGPEAFIKNACHGLLVTPDWVHQFVIDNQDVEDIKNGDLSLSCLRAHIEYHIEEQRKWQEFKQRLNQQK